PTSFYVTYTSHPYNTNHSLHDALPIWSNASPGATASMSASASTRASQSGPSLPPPASQPHRPPCNSLAPAPSSRLRLADSTSCRGGKAGGTGGFRAVERKSRTSTALLHATVPRAMRLIALVAGLRWRLHSSCP